MNLNDFLTMRHEILLVIMAMILLIVELNLKPGKKKQDHTDCNRSVFPEYVTWFSSGKNREPFRRDVYHIPSDYTDEKYIECGNIPYTYTISNLAETGK